MNANGATREPLIEFRNVYKSFGDFAVLKNVNLSIYEGEITAIIGKSGVGKSVFLKHIIGLLEPDAGEILFKGRDLLKMNSRERRSVKKYFSYMFQNMALFDSMTVFENIALPLTEKTTLTKAEIEAKVLEKAKALEIGEVLQKFPSQLSGGMKKRVAFARALITEPEIVLFDEPTTGLDPIRKNAIFSMISTYQRRYNFTAIVVSHDIPDIFYVAQRVAMLEKGSIIYQGPAEDIRSSTLPEVQEFVTNLEGLRDELTGLDAAHKVEMSFRKEVCRSVESSNLFTIVLFRVENMEGVADTFGHRTAQSLMKEFAGRIKNRLRPFDVSARFSMNEIMTILPNTTHERAMTFCKQVAEDLAAHPLLDEYARSTVDWRLTALAVEAGPDVDLRALVRQRESCRFELTIPGVSQTCQLDEEATA